MTGSGKTQWVKDALYEHAKKQGKRILLLSNRNVLKRQNEHELGNKRDIITLKNYQSIETRILHGSSINEVLDDYDYIIFDECHYWFSDSEFNRNTDLMIEAVKTPSPNKIYIYLTATPDVLLLYHDRFEYVYPSSKQEKQEFFNYDFVESVYL
jgi:superfamily II DNA or RNA helicase